MSAHNTKTMGIEQFKTALKRHSLKATPQRLAVHEAMMCLGHASADMVTEYIRQNLGTNVTVASVYNILTQLSCLGIYSHRMSANNKMYFDVNTFPHMHIYDRESHIYKDVIDDELIGIVEEKLRHRRFKGFRIEHIDIQLIGVSSKKKFQTA